MRRGWRGRGRGGNRQAEPRRTGCTGGLWCAAQHHFQQRRQQGQVRRGWRGRGCARGHTVFVGVACTLGAWLDVKKMVDGVDGVFI